MGNIQYRAIHTRTKWRKVGNHNNLENALYGKKDGAPGLFARKVRIDYEKHGDPTGIIAWKDGELFATAVRPDAHASGEAIYSKFPIDIALRFEAAGGASTREFDALFGTHVEIPDAPIPPPISTAPEPEPKQEPTATRGPSINKPMSVKQLEEIGRIRLSPNFFLRDFLHSEISQVEGIPNIPIDVDLAVRAGKGLCENILEPMQEALGRISIRSAYRSPTVNEIGNKKKYNCASNDNNRARHIWDLPDSAGNIGATACIVVNSFVDYREATGNWPALAWWVHDHIPAYRDIMFFDNLAAFNINWYSGSTSEQKIASQVVNPQTGKKGILTRTGMENASGTHADEYQLWLSQKTRV